MAKRRRRNAELKRVAKAFKDVGRETDAFWQPRSYIDMHLVCMRALGWKDVDYETLVTVSGFGTSFAYEPREKAWAGWVAPYGCDQRITGTTGFGFKWDHVDSLDQAWDLITKHVGEGAPVRAPHTEEMVIAGYKEAATPRGRRVLVMCRPFADPPKWWRWAQLEEWFADPQHHWLGHHTRSVRKLATKRSGLNAMAAAVMVALHDPRAKNSMFEGVAWGLEGIKQFAEDVADTKKKKDYFAAGWHGCHAITPQYTGRRCAAVYVRRIAERFPVKSNTYFLKAADEYEAAYGEWLSFRETEAARGSWGNAKRRAAMADAIYRALIHEIAAVDALRDGLLMEGVRVMPTR